MRQNLYLVTSVLLILIVGSAANARPSVAVDFAGSIADRKGLVEGSCEIMNVTLRSKGMWQICFDHTFTSFDDFQRSWNQAAEWEDVFLPADNWLRFTAQENAAGAGTLLSGGLVYRFWAAAAHLQQDLRDGRWQLGL